MQATGLLAKMNDQLQLLQDRGQQELEGVAFVSVVLSQPPPGPPLLAADGPAAPPTPGAVQSGQQAASDQNQGQQQAVQQLEREIAMMIPAVQRELVQSGSGLPGNPPLQLPSQVGIMRRACMQLCV